MAWMKTYYSKDTHFRLRIKWRLEHVGAQGIMGEAALKVRVMGSSTMGLAQSYDSQKVICT